MMRICLVCDKPLRAGDHVMVTVYAIYEELKSQVHWALGKPYDACGETLRHRDCEDPQYEK